jgi:hypothetical protein
MLLKSNQILLLTIIFGSISVSIAGFIHSYSMPHFDAVPIQKQSTPLAQQDVEDLLGKKFKMIWRVRQVPLAIKQSFSNLTGIPFDLADPGERLGSDDLADGGYPRCLAFVGLSDNLAVLVYQQGGFVSTDIAVVFSFVDNGHAWAASFAYRIRNIADLRALIRTGKFEVWDPRPL